MDQPRRIPRPSYRYQYLSCWDERVGYLCDSFIRDDDIRENAVIFDVSVSVAAQHITYSASKVFECCKQESTLLHGHLGRKKWIAGFKEAQTNPLIDTSGKKHAELWRQ